MRARHLAASSGRLYLGRDAVGTGLHNPIERCWGVLENHWNGALLSSIELVLDWAGTMTWPSIQPIVYLIDKVYERGVKLTKAAFRPIAERRPRSDQLPKWSVTIKPATG